MSRRDAVQYMHEYDMWDECEHITDKDRIIRHLVTTLFKLEIL